MTHELPVRIYYEDTDMAGIVYYANYLKFFERGRSEAVRAAGIDQREMKDARGIVFAVRRAEVEYLLPARLDDLLTIRTWVDRLGGATLVMGQEARLGETLLTQGVIKVACMTSDGKVSRFPVDVRQKLASLAPATV